MERSLSIARDRVVGILLGLFMMSLVFDRLWGSRAAVEMKTTFISNLRLLAQFAKEPLSKDLKVGIERSYSLRETINSTFDQVRSLGDAVLFEFSSSRQQDLALRSRIRQWQPQLRTLFVIRITLLKYRLQLPGFELPETLLVAQQEFDDRLAGTLDGIANRLEGKASQEKDNFGDSFERLVQTIRSCCSEGPQELTTAELQTFLALSLSIESVTMSLSREI